MLDQPGVAFGHQNVAIPAEVVEPDVRQDGEVRRNVRPLGGQVGEQHVGDVVPDDRLDVGAGRDVAADTAQEPGNLGSPAQRLLAAYFENTISAERLGKVV